MNKNDLAPNLDELKIEFVYQDTIYEVGMRAYDLNRMVLPDGTVIEASEGWLESLPPVPRGLREVLHLFKDRPVAEIVTLMNAEIATRVD